MTFLIVTWSIMVTENILLIQWIISAIIDRREDNDNDILE